MSWMCHNIPCVHLKVLNITEKEWLYSHTLKCPYLYTQKRKKSVRNPSFFSHLKTHWLQSRTSDLRNNQPRFPCDFESMDINFCHSQWSQDLIVRTVAFPSARQGKADPCRAPLCPLWAMAFHSTIFHTLLRHMTYFDLTTFWFRKPRVFVDFMQWKCCIYYILSWKHRLST